MINNKMIKWAQDLFPICRSITGNGQKETLEYLKNINNDMKIIKVKTGQKFFDWSIPKEWNIKEAYLEHENGKKFANFKDNNLHVINYSEPINKILNLNKLKKNIYTLPKQKTAVPYVTSYYRDHWGFCMSHNKYKKLPKGNYRAFIDSKKENGHLRYGEITIKGKSKKQILFSTYICHPSMANNELSGPVVNSALVQYIKKKFKNNYYTYKFIFIPETIGSIVYISKNIKNLKNNFLSGFIISCVGDERAYSMIESKYGNSLSDFAIKSALCHKKNFKIYNYLERGSDERQFNSPGVDLPVSGFCKTKYGKYPEYHTDKDNFKVVTSNGLNQSLNVLKDIVNIFESGLYPKSKIVCEPFMTKRNLYSTLGIKDNEENKKIRVRDLMNFLAYADGKNSIFEIALIIKKNLTFVEKINGLLKKNKLI